jgi:hypothetical protein|nr:MAG TPA: Leucine-rich Immune Molecule [Caudoviricetes sp.]
MANSKLMILASDVAMPQQEHSDIFLLIEMRILSTRPNGNNEGVTEAFIDEIVTHPDKYACLPLYADVTNLLRGAYQHLGHMYDCDTNSFGTKQIGSITNLHRVNDEYGVSLIGQARIPKREEDVCNALMELYSRGILKFSFEIQYASDAAVEENGVLYVDANEMNALTGVAVVSIPAYDESVALKLVAQQHGTPHEGKASEAKNEGVENGMTLEEAMASLSAKDEQIAALTARAEKAEKELDEEKAAKEAQNDAHGKDVDALETELAQKDSACAELNAKIEAFKAVEKENESLRAELTQLKHEKAEAETKQKQEKAKNFAELQGLDLKDETVAKAVDAADYQMLAELCVAKREPQSPKFSIASLAGDGFEMLSEYGDLV